MIHRKKIIVILVVLMLFIGAELIEAAAWPVLKKQIREKYQSVRQITVPELVETLQKDASCVLLIDVRKGEEYKVSHLKGAVHIEKPEKIIEYIHEQDPSENRKVILYCSVGYRSSAMARLIQKKVKVPVYNLEGSIFEWANKGYPVYQGKQSVQKVHPYSYSWGLLLKKKYRSYR